MFPSKDCYLEYLEVCEIGAKMVIWGSPHFKKLSYRGYASILRYTHITPAAEILHSLSWRPSSFKAPCESQPQPVREYGSYSN